MKITRFYATADGGSRFTEIDIPVEHAQPDADGNTLRFSNAYVSPNVRFAELPEGMVQGWHHAPARQIVVVLSGVLEVGTSDNQTRRWRAGEAFLADDLTGKGHTTRTVEGPVHVLFAPLPPGFVVERWSA
jgi:quercetin dioxygenase-like cupin family protein